MNRVNTITPIRSTFTMRSSGALLNVVVTLALAYGLDRWIEASRRMTAETFQFMPVAWTMTAANVLLAGALLVVARELHRP
jgi:uncharacterized membrane protein YidH (DUF202 family)